MKLRLGALIVMLAVALLAAPVAAEAQQTGKPYRIGFLGNSTAALEANLVRPFREGLRDLGALGLTIPQSVLLRATEVLQ
jgi:hypothetical protein